ncbi:MAG: exodeoxyribonuclease V subunit alpha [Psychrobacter sp.]|nr:exodeoxyribonuclease V subunit alpha [Psychrobacter sp.]
MSSINNNSNPNSNAASQVSPSWAHTVSDYLLQRRAQTQLAYQTAFNAQDTQVAPLNDVKMAIEMDAENMSRRAGQGMGIANEVNQNTDWLFKTLFIALAQQLEEGHTVLTLSTDNEANIVTEAAADFVNSAQTPSSLNTWQRQLLSIIISPLMDMMDKAVIPAAHKNENESQLDKEPLGQLLSKWPQVAMQLALSPEHSKVLNERHELGSKLIAYFLESNQLQVGLKNSLSNFINFISQNDLFSNVDLRSSDHNTAPICFSCYKTENGLSITLWLYRTWQAEHTLAQQIQQISGHKVKALAITINNQLNTEQQAAINMANHNAFSIITGGPGTGKTYTVAQLVMALKDSQSSNKKSKATNKPETTSLALAAPTGKAAQRMQESLQAALDAAGVSMQLQEAKTIHRLLGIGQSGRPRYHTNNPLSEDIVIVDEASMLGVELANHLVSAIKPGARLILLGDANQLAAVDAGAVLADLCRIPMLQPMHQQLIDSRRFSNESGIGQLAGQINALEVDMKAVWQIMNHDDALAFYPVNQFIISSENDAMSGRKNSEASQTITPQYEDTIIKNSLSNQKLIKNLTNNYQPFLNLTKQILTKSQIANSVPINTTNSNININELMATLNQFRILTAGHHGRWGDISLNNTISQWHIGELKLPVSNSPWFHGRPVMVLQNSYEMGLFNGDIGICLQTSRGLEVFFENKPQGIAVNLLNDEMIATAYAMTIHKSQGSEFDHVAITFDDSNSRLLSKELIYTAVTRAKQQVSIYSTKSALTRAISTPTIRQTGLALQFEGLQNPNTNL